MLVTQKAWKIEHIPITSLLQDITSLLHTIYEVVDASVNHSPSSSKTLRGQALRGSRFQPAVEGAVRRVAAGKSRIITVGGGAAAEEKWGHSGVPLALPAVSSARDVFVVMQKGGCFRPVRALFRAVSESLHLSHSMGFIFNDGGEWQSQEWAPSLSAFKYSERNLKRSAESFW